MTTDEQVKAIQKLDQLHLRAKRSGLIADVKRYERERRRLELVMRFAAERQVENQEAA